MPIYRYKSDGYSGGNTWGELSNIYRFNGSTWQKIKKIYRYKSIGYPDGNVWNLVFQGSDTPQPKTPYSSLFVHSSTYGTVGSTTEFYSGDNLRLSRGAWTQSPTAYQLRIQTSTLPGSGYGSVSSATYNSSSSPTAANTTSDTYISYTISASDALYPSYYVKGRVDATNADGTTPLETAEVLLRIGFGLDSFSATSPTAYGATFSWSISGVPSSSYIYSQVLTIRRTSDNVVVKTVNVTPGTTIIGVSDSSVISPNTSYYAKLVVTAYDSWYTTGTPTTRTTDYNLFTTTSPPPTNTVAPTLKPLNNRSGVGLAGYVPYSTTLTASQGTWTNVSGTTTYQYDWTMDDGNVPTIYTNVGSTKTFSLADLGNSLFVKVKATNTDGGYGFGYSDAYQIMAPISITAANTTANVNTAKTFTCTIANFPARYTINWGDGTSSYNSGSIAVDTNIINVSQSHTYTTTGDKTVTITAYYKNDESPVTSTVTITVYNPLPENTVAPTIGPLNNAGGLPVISTLTATTGTWNNVSGSTTYNYDWYREDSTGGALFTFLNSGNTRSFGSGDVADYVYVRVKATNTDGGFAYALSPTYVLYSQVAVGSVSPTTATQNSSTNFAFNVSNYPSSYTIDWGDGTTNYSSGSITANTATVNASVAHTYTTTGSKTITVTAQPGNITSTTNITVNAPNLTPPTITSATQTVLGGTLTVTVSGGSGPAYQIYWTASTSAPSVSVTPDGGSTTTTITDSTGPTATGTYYVYARSAATTTTTGTTAPSTTLSLWSSAYSYVLSATRTLSYDKNTTDTVGSMPNSQSGTDSGSGATLTISSNTPTRTGYTFAGWNTNSAGTGTNYTAGGSITLYGDVTLYAKWTSNNVAPFNGSVTIARQSGSGSLSAARWGDVYYVSSATASGTPTPSVSSYQWQRYNALSDTWSNVSGETGSTFTITSSHTGANFRCSVVFSNTVSPDLTTVSNSLFVSNPTVTAITSYYRSTLAISATKSNGYPTRPPITTGALNATYYYVVWYVEGYNMSGMNSKTVLNGTVQATPTASDSFNIYPAATTLPDGSSYSGGIYRNTGAASAGSGNSVALRVQPTSGASGSGVTGFAQQTNAVVNSNQGGPVTNSFSQVTF